MADDRITHLIGALLKKTREDALDWGGTQAEAAYRTDVGKHIVVVSKEQEDPMLFGFRMGGPARLQVWFRLYGEDENVLETVGELQLKEALYEGQNGADMLRELYNRARRRALGIDGVIDQVISDLESNGR